MSKKRDRAELEARRLEGARLLQRGAKPAEVARRLQVSRTSVWRWEQALEEARSCRTGSATFRGGAFTAAWCQAGGGGAAAPSEPHVGVAVGTSA